ncbi:hypothetical protein [Crocosphaera sp.]|uniref:hypothetical protein n=1 Tax=Crocosphaera sp. TaxID=2729996 RepID=UPI003F21F882
MLLNLFQIELLKVSAIAYLVGRIVEDEASKGDPKIAPQRLALLQTLTFLDLTPEATELAQEFLEKSNLPAKAANDALHIAIATVRSPIL